MTDKTYATTHDLPAFSTCAAPAALNTNSKRDTEEASPALSMEPSATVGGYCTSASDSPASEQPAPSNDVTPTAHSGGHQSEQQPESPPTSRLPEWPQICSALHALDWALRHRAADADIGPYHSSAVPPTPLVDFAHFICARTRYNVAGLAIAVALLARRSAAGRPLCALSMHRVLLACIVVGAKANFDRFIRNDHVAGLCGVELSELNFLEATLLDELDWRVTPTTHDLATAPEVLRRLALVQA